MDCLEEFVLPTPCIGAETQPRREKREESFVRVEITGPWVRAEKGTGGRIVLGVVCAGVETPAS
jgi:hypothetical protein